MFFFSLKTSFFQSNSNSSPGNSLSDRFLPKPVAVILLLHKSLMFHIKEPLLPHITILPKIIVCLNFLHRHLVSYSKSQTCFTTVISCSGFAADPNIRLRIKLLVFVFWLSHCLIGWWCSGTMFNVVQAALKRSLTLVPLWQLNGGQHKHPQI